MAAETLDDLTKPILDEKGWTLGELAKRAKVSPSGLRKIMRGQVVEVRGPTVRDLAKALGVDAARVRAACEASRAAAEKQ